MKFKAVAKSCNIWRMYRDIYARWDEISDIIHFMGNPPTNLSHVCMYIVNFVASALYSFVLSYNNITILCAYMQVSGSTCCSKSPGRVRSMTLTN